MTNPPRPTHHPLPAWAASLAAGLLVLVFTILVLQPERNPAVLLLAPAAALLVGLLRLRPSIANFDRSPARKSPSPLGEPASASLDGSPYVFDGHLLYRRTIQNADGNERLLYFFAKEQPPEGATPTPMPAGFSVTLNPRTGKPVLQRTR